MRPTISLLACALLAGCADSTAPDDDVTSYCTIEVNEDRWEPAYVSNVSWADVRANAPRLAPEIQAHAGEESPTTVGDLCSKTGEEVRWLEETFEADPEAEPTWITGKYALYFLETETPNGTALLSLHPETLE